MATYYVSTTGNNSNVGSLASPWLTMQRGTQSPVAPGDTVYFLDGTYAEPAGSGGVSCWISTSRSSIAGTVGNPITLKSLNQYGAQLTIPSSTNGTNTPIFVARNYYTIDGFDISGGTAALGSEAYHGIVVATATGTIIQNCKIHDVGRTVCSNSGNGYTGIFLGQGAPTTTTIQNNLIYKVGRLRNGESACVTTMFQQDHGMYIDGDSGGVNGLTIQRNVIYDTNRGYCIQFFGQAGATVQNCNVYNNTFADGSPTGSPNGHLILCRIMTNVNIKNNISYSPPTAMIHYFACIPTNVVIDHNLYYNAIDYNGSGSDARPGSGLTITNNLLSTTPGFTNAATRDYTLTAAAYAIDKGVDVGLAFTGSAPDMGYVESAGVDTTPPAVPTGLAVH